MAAPRDHEDTVWEDEVAEATVNSTLFTPNKMEYGMDRLLEKVIPNEVSSIDGAIMVSALSKTASFVVDLDNIENDRTKFVRSWSDSSSYELCCIDSDFRCDFTIDDDGRIAMLRICDQRPLPLEPELPEELEPPVGTEVELELGEEVVERPLPLELELPEELEPPVGTEVGEEVKNIARFERLTDLTLYHCQSIPVELSNLPQLQTLTLHDCSDLFDNDFPVQMVLSKLKKLTIHCFRSESTPTSVQLIAWMTKQLPILEELNFSSLERNETDSVLNALSTVEDICFKGTLKSLKMSHCGIDQNVFETLWSKIVPKLTELFSLDLEANNIESIQPTVERIINDNITVIPNQLQVLRLTCNPIMKNLKEDPNEKVAMLSFLKSYNSIYSIWSCEYEGEDYRDCGYSYDSDIEYELRINHAGRSIVECSDRKEDHHPSLPLSLWPIVLERAYKKSDHIYPRGLKIRKNSNSTGLNYLVREVGLTLISQCIALRVQSSNDTTEIGGEEEEEEEDTNDNKNENEYVNDIEEGEDNSSVLTVPSLKGGERKRKRNLLDNTWVANT